MMLDNFPRGTICIEDLEIGMTRHLRKVVTDRDIALFAEVSTDHNPVHLDEAYAQDTIFEGRIAHGMLTAGLISAVIGEPWHGLFRAEPEVPCPRPPRRSGACRGKSDCD
jgi:3-hydroxybutyryl-CoA dehydratase